jgi:hypothetical protein
MDHVGKRAGLVLVRIETAKRSSLSARASANSFGDNAPDTGAANRIRTCDPVITKREIVESVKFTPEPSRALRAASRRVLSNVRPDTTQLRSQRRDVARFGPITTHALQQNGIATPAHTSGHNLWLVMPALVAGIHVFKAVPHQRRGWPGIGERKRRRPSDGYARP